MELAGGLTPDEFWDQYDDVEKLVRDSAGELPCFGVSGWRGPIAVGEWDLGSRPPVTVSLVHGSALGPEIHVRTTSQDPRRTVLFQRMMTQGPPADTNDLLESQQVLDAEPAEELPIPVDGHLVSFTIWRETERWWGAGTYAGSGLVLDVRGIIPGSLALESVHDIEAYLNGSRAKIRATRGEN